MVDGGDFVGVYDGRAGNEGRRDLRDLSGEIQGRQACDEAKQYQVLQIELPARRVGSVFLVSVLLQILHVSGDR